MVWEGFELPAARLFFTSVQTVFTVSRTSLRLSLFTPTGVFSNWRIRECFFGERTLSVGSVRCFAVVATVKRIILQERLTSPLPGREGITWQTSYVHKLYLSSPPAQGTCVRDPLLWWMNIFWWKWQSSDDDDVMHKYYQGVGRCSWRCGGWSWKCNKLMISTRARTLSIAVPFSGKPNPG